MANVQLQRQQTITKTAIAQKQSQEVVQTIVHGGLSSISYLREFFPETAYVQRVYGEGDVLPSYEDYAEGDLPSKRRASDPRPQGGTVMQVLRKGKSRRVDKLLDWLEHGAFPAIETGNLRALHVLVHADPKDRSQVIESYTFTVKYVHDAEYHQIAAGIEVGKPGSKAVTVGATSNALQELLRHINDLCEGLPALPRTRYVSMALVYNENTRIPEGWTSTTSDKFLLGGAEGWLRREESFDNVFSAYHETSLEVSYLRNPTDTTIPPSSIIPDGLSYTEERAMLTGPEPDHQSNGPVTDALTEGLSNPFDDTQFPMVPIPPPEVPAAEESVPTQSLPLTLGEAAPVETAQQSSIVPVRERVEGPAEYADTQSSNIAEMRDAFLEMMQPEHITQSDTQTQAPFFRPPAASETTVSPSRGERSPSVFKDGAQKPDQRLVQSQATIARLEPEKTRRRNRAKTKSKGHEDVVKCQCGYDEEEGQMIYCSVCETWQHLHCYGFTGDNDPRMPEEHVCYQCLLDESEPQTMERLSGLITKRRVIHILQAEGPKKASDVANLMQAKITDVEVALDSLKRDGFVLAAKGTKKASASRTAYTAVKSGAAHEKMLDELFDPLTLISHHYVTSKPVVQNPLNSRLANAAALSMPPPTTPASRMRRSTQTPGLGREVSASASPSMTPSRRHIGQTSNVKRSHQEAALDVDDVSHAKRVQTQFLLDAGGLPSSPAGSAFG